MRCLHITATAHGGGAQSRACAIASRKTCACAPGQSARPAEVMECVAVLSGMDGWAAELDRAGLHAEAREQRPSVASSAQLVFLYRY